MLTNFTTKNNLLRVWELFTLGSFDISRKSERGTRLRYGVKGQLTNIGHVIQRFANEDTEEYKFVVKGENK